MPVALKIDWSRVRSQYVGATRDMIRELETVMLREMDRTRSYAIANRFATDPGPPSDLLHVRTGALRASLFAAAKASGGAVVGVLGAGVPYARIHELGETVNVPTHTQHRTSAFGRPTRPYEVTVRAHAARYPQRAFLRPSLEARRDEILAALAGRARAFFA